MATDRSTNGTGPAHGPPRPDPAAVPPLPGDDAPHLASLERKLQLVRDRVAAVADGTATGFFLYGPGGVSKSHTVLDKLNRSRAEYVLFNSPTIGRGLFNILQAHPDAVLVLEDTERVFRDPGAQGVLRSALWGQPVRDGSGGRERTVTWTNPRQTLSSVFTRQVPSGEFVLPLLHGLLCVSFGAGLIGMGLAAGWREPEGDEPAAPGNAPGSGRSAQ